jgi:hypothetical protein
MTSNGVVRITGIQASHRTRAMYRVVIVCTRDARWTCHHEIDTNVAAVSGVGAHSPKTTCTRWTPVTGPRPCIGDYHPSTSRSRLATPLLAIGTPRTRTAEATKGVDPNHLRSVPTASVPRIADPRSRPPHRESGYRPHNDCLRRTRTRVDPATKCLFAASKPWRERQSDRAAPLQRMPSGPCHPTCLLQGRQQLPWSRSPRPRPSEAS